MDFIIVTGMSGAGKSAVLNILEDMGFFCVDNLPPLLIPNFVRACFNSKANIDKVALGLDIRGGKLFDDFFIGLNNLDKEYKFKILFLDASDNVLLKRYKESRRTHPLSKNNRLIDNILKERELLINVKNKSDYILDTTYILSRELKEQIKNILFENKKFSNIIITILSFGFKHGTPNDADLIFDVRFIPNPFYIEELKEKNGEDKDVKSYVLKHKVSLDFLDKLIDMLEFLFPFYVKEGKNQLVIGIGCTGGKHRSVALSRELYNYLQSKDHNVLINHRDISKDYGGL